MGMLTAFRHFLGDQGFGGAKRQLIRPILVMFFQKSPKLSPLSAGRILDLEAYVAQRCDRPGSVWS